MFRFIVLVAGALLSGCATVPPANTPSGNPEVTLSGVRADCVRSGFLNILVNQGYAIHKTTDTQIVGGRRTKNFAAGLFLGTRFGGDPEERLTVLFIPQGTPDTIRVVLTSAAYVSNQGTGFEKVHPIRGTQKDQDMFMVAKSRIEYKCRK
ncbi:MAG: hypothetical protein IH977_03370 [Nitrospinae bacterium]|nr:hypothetical protein [Nitrospinota bacterium]